MEKNIIDIPQPLVGLLPVPVVLVSCIDLELNRPNIITIGWVGVICSDPPMVSISIRPTRYSFNLIEKTKDFVINIPTLDIIKEVDFCGTRTGRSVDKFEKTGFSRIPAKYINSPLIEQCPFNLECVVENLIHLGSHTVFFGKVVAFHIDSNLHEDGIINYRSLKLLSINGFEYWSLYEKCENVFFTLKSNRIKKQSHAL